MLLRFKISLLAVFLVFTLLGMAALSLEALLIGLTALGLALALALGNTLLTGRKTDHELNTSF